MVIEEIKTEDYIIEEMEKAKTRISILGSHSAPAKKVKASSGKVSGKSGRMKQFIFKPDLDSWKLYIKQEIPFDKMKELQAKGK